MNWKNKKGKQVLEEANVICRVSPDGTYVIKSPEGHWNHEKASSVEEAIKACEEYVIGQLGQKKSIDDAHLRCKVTGQLSNHPDVKAIAIVAGVVWAYAQLPLDVRPEARKVLKEKDIYERVAPFLDDKDIMLLAAKKSKATFIEYAKQEAVKSVFWDLKEKDKAK